MKKRWPYLVMAVLVLFGLAVLFYPSVSNWYNERFHIQAISEYNTVINNLSHETREGELEKAKEYNGKLTGSGITDPFLAGSGMVLPDNYMDIMNEDGNGIMGTMLIPEIEVKLPIYHGTSEEALEKGVGHMEMTAFPIGGEGNHAVLTGHTALPGAVLFSNLMYLEIGSRFYIEIYGLKLAYEVDQIETVEPHETDLLRPVAGEDYCTLITCTPYAINSHRLLVRGVRVEYVEAEEEAIEPVVSGSTAGEHTAGSELTWAVLALVAVLLALDIVFIVSIRRKKRRV